jgi:probable rRNA maturation factor
VLCPQVAAKQARKAGHDVQDELELLCTHGILHLLGYDHADPAEHAIMFSLQDKLLAAWRSERGSGHPEGQEPEGQDPEGQDPEGQEGPG